MLIIYDFIFLLAAFFYLLRYLLKRKFHRGMLARFGFLPEGLSLDKPIWVHAVSVGEAVVVKGFIEKLREYYPGKKIVITTVTATGNKIAKTLAKEGDFVTYFPLDLSFIVRRVIKKINPCLVVVAETEVWPNFITILNKKNIPIAIINARISDKSFIGYKKVKFFIKPVLNRVNLFCAQTKDDASKLEVLGVKADRIKVTGNMKFDGSLRENNTKELSGLKKRLNFGQLDKIFIAGSTHQGEEEIILKAYEKIKVRFVNLKLILVPRHPERAEEVGELVKERGFVPVFTSDLPGASELQKEAVFILNTIGQLMDYYAISDIVFVGGSLIPKGGHNILEPASLGKPVIIGPYMFNFRDIADVFVQKKACLMVSNQEGLEDAITDLLADGEKIDQLTGKAKILIEGNKGATARNLDYVKAYL